jgi:hypothetical protein
MTSINKSTWNLVVAFLFMVTINSCSRINNTNNGSTEHTKITIKDSTLKRLLSNYVLNKHINKKECVFQLFVVSNNYKQTSYFVTYALFASDLIRFVPSGYFYLEGEWVLYYTGFDQFFTDRSVSIDASKFKGKQLFWDINLPLHKSEIDRKNWVFMKTKLTRLYTHEADSNKWVIDVATDDILYENIPKKCETEYFRNP